MVVRTAVSHNWDNVGRGGVGWGGVGQRAAVYSILLISASAPDEPFKG